MRSVLLVTAALGIISTIAFADETLKWRHVQHLVSSQTQEVGDVNGHILNIYRLLVYWGLLFSPMEALAQACRLAWGIPSTVMEQLTAIIPLNLMMAQSCGLSTPEHESWVIQKLRKRAPRL
jgi:hypothetical protein